MKKRPLGEGRVYLRRSDNRQELSLGTQLEWAIGRARSLNVALSASLADVDEMVANGESARGHVCLDSGITGADLMRPGLAALRRAVHADQRISHVFAYRRDRLGRPEDLVDMMQIELELLQPGVTLVFSEGIVEPSPRGKTDLAHIVQMIFSYHESGAFLQTHAERILQAQKRLAREGFRTGGNAPYGFGRFLVTAQGDVLEELPPGRRVRQAGCHVRILPSDQQKLSIWIYILDLKHRGWGCKRIAQHLNEMGVPSPGAGSVRTDQGAKHRVTGKWCANSVAELCRNPAILGIQEFGQRSEGAHRRLGMDGPRLLEETDRLPDQRPRIVFNDPSVRVTASLGIDPKYSREKWKEIQEVTADRGKSQRGVPRSKDPARYPLACRVHDLSAGCGSIMYGVTVGKRSFYRCSRYTRTAGAQCHQNSVDAEKLLAFASASILRQIMPGGERDKLRAALAKRATESAPTVAGGSSELLEQRRQRLADLRTDIATIERRLATEQDDSLYEVLSRQFREVQQEMRTTEQEVERLSRDVAASQFTNPDAEIEAAMSLIDNWQALLSNPAARQELPAVFEQLGMRIGVYFREGILGTKRVVRQFASGILAFGNAALPQPIHGNDHIATNSEATGETVVLADNAQKLPPSSGDGEQFDFVDRPNQGNSSTKVSRGDRI